MVVWLSGPGDMATTDQTPFASFALSITASAKICRSLGVKPLGNHAPRPMPRFVSEHTCFLSWTVRRLALGLASLSSSYTSTYFWPSPSFRRQLRHQVETDRV